MVKQKWMPKTKKKFKLIYVYGITNSYDSLNKFTFYLYAWIPWSNIEIIKEITIHKPWADSFLMGILHYFDIWIFRNFYISSLLEKRIVPSKYWKIKMTWNCGFINFFFEGWGEGDYDLHHCTKKIMGMIEISDMN